MPTLMLTAFEPFDSDTVNASLEVAPSLADAASAVFNVYLSILPVDAVRAPAQVQELLLTQRPDWCIMLGQANGRAALSVERVALNLCDFRIPDNGGHQLRDEPVVAGGPAAYFATLPTKQLVAVACEAGTPAEPSLSAGAFLCNLVSYVALHTCATAHLPTRCGFVHLPLLPQQASAARAVPTMERMVMQRGLAAMLAVLAAVSRVDVPVLA